MRCHICNSTLKTPQYNNDHDDWDPCGTCLQIISEVFGDESDDDSEVILGDATEEELEALYDDLDYDYDPTSHLKKDLC